MMRALLERVLDGGDLAADEAETLLAAFLDEGVPDVQKAAMLAALRAKGETADEVRGLALGMRAAARPVRLEPGMLAADTCGTGGDGSGSFNVSTAAALVVAAAGVPVVKHGNRSVSSRCGSADVLEALGIPLATDASMARRQLTDAGFTFLYAPSFHPATAAVARVRKGLGVRTVFNVLGPLTNPAAPPFQLVGAFDAPTARTMAAALAGMPIRRCAVVHGAPSWDEATPCGPFLRLDVTPGEVVETEVDPLEVYGVDRCDPGDLAGGDADENARLLEALFAGSRSAIRDAVLLNAAIVLEITGIAHSPQEAFARAAAVLDDGRGPWFLERLRQAA